MCTYTNQIARAVLHCIPAHCGVSGNEKTDVLARESARGEQDDNSVIFSEKETSITMLTMPRLQRDDYHTVMLTRELQVLLVRLFNGHN